MTSMHFAMLFTNSTETHVAALYRQLHLLAISAKLMHVMDAPSSFA